MLTSPKDLTSLSYDEWIDFTFGHPAGDRYWYLRSEWEYTFSSTERLADHCIHLFSKPQFLLTQFSLAQLEQAFWFIPGPLGYMRHLTNENIEWSVKHAWIGSIRILFTEIFAVAELDEPCHMWFDNMFTFSSIMKNKSLVSAVLDVLSAILEVPSRRCRLSALHGLGHLQQLRAVAVQATIKAFLDQSAENDEEMRRFANLCVTGGVL